MNTKANGELTTKEKAHRQKFLFKEEDMNILKVAQLTLNEQLEMIPKNTFFHASRYNNDLYLILHLWDDKGNSFDIVARKE